MTDTITLPRSVIEQALDALNGAEQMNASRPDKFELELSADEIDTLSSKLRAALAQQAEHGIIRNFDLIGFLPSEEKRQQTVISQTELRAVLAQQAEQGWVLLNDGIPQPHQMVLVARGKFVTTGSYSPEFGWEWAELDGEDDDSVATHWMPLPSSPKEKK